MQTVSFAQIRRWCNGVAVSLDELLKPKRIRKLIRVEATLANREENMRWK